MRLQNPFSAIDTAGIDSQVLTVLARLDGYLPVQQIQKMIPETGSVEGVRKSVGRLVTEGTVLERITGRSAAYALNREHLLAEPILRIARAKLDFVDRLARLVSEWQIQPLTVTLFGSAARNEMQSDSDIDLLVVLPDQVDIDHAELLIDHLAAQANIWTGNDIRPLLYRSSEVTAARIFDEILHDGVNIMGDPTWLRRRLQGNKQSVEVA